MRIDEAELVAVEAALQAGESEALARLFEHHREELERILRFRLAGALARRIDLDDLLQEVYLAAASRIAHYAKDGYREPLVWLRQIAMQTLIDQQRHHLGARMRDAHRDRAMAAGDTSGAMVFQYSAGVSSPSAKLKKADQLERLKQVIDGLDQIDREILALRNFEGLGNKAVAEVLGISVKAASLRYVRALRRLQDELDSQGLKLGDDA